jgi:hypothetical protein
MDRGGAAHPAPRLARRGLTLRSGPSTTLLPPHRSRRPRRPSRRRPISRITVLKPLNYNDIETARNTDRIQAHQLPWHLPLPARALPRPIAAIGNRATGGGHVIPAWPIVKSSNLSTGNRTNLHVSVNRLHPTFEPRPNHGGIRKLDGKWRVSPPGKKFDLGTNSGSLIVNQLAAKRSIYAI